MECCSGIFAVHGRYYSTCVVKLSAGELETISKNNLRGIILKIRL